MARMTADMRMRLKRLDALQRDGRPKSRLELHAIERQRHDLQTAHARGLFWDEAEVQRTIQLFGVLRHPKGRHAGKPFLLEPWQEDLWIAPLFGWMWGQAKREGGRRRFRSGYTEIPRKNGKTAVAAAIVHKLTVADDEINAHTFCLAGSAQQCRTLFDDFIKGLARGTDLEKFYEFYDRTLWYRRGGKIELLPANAETAHSQDPHAFVLDEVHVQKTRKLWDAMITGQGLQLNPIALGITTAGWDRSSLCWELHEDARQVLDPDNPIEDDSLFSLIYTIDQGDDWRDPLSWRKANPNLGVTVTEEFYRDQVAKAERSPGVENSFRQLNLDEWTQQAVFWLSMDEWDACRDDSIDETHLQTLPCWAGLDMGEHRDLTCFTLVFRDGDRFIWKLISWAPEESTSDRADRDRSFVKRWMQNGQVRRIPGRDTDPGLVARDIADCFKRYRIQSLAFDPSGAVKSVFEKLFDEHGIDTTPEHGVTVEFYQGFRNFTPILREFPSICSARRFAHDGDPVLRWQAANLSVKRNHKDEMMCDKSASADKIDGMVAGFMALSLAYERGVVEKPFEYSGAVWA